MSNFVIKAKDFSTAIGKVQKAVGTSADTVNISIGKRCFVGAETEGCRVIVYFKPSKVLKEGQFSLSTSILSMLDYDGEVNIEVNEAKNKLQLSAVKGRYKGAVSINRFTPIKVVTKQMKERSNPLLSPETQKCLMSLMNLLPLAPTTDSIKVFSSHFIIKPGFVQLYMGDDFSIAFASVASKKIKESLNITIPKNYEPILANLFDNKDSELSVIFTENTMTSWNRDAEVQFPLAIEQLSLDYVTKIRALHEDIKPQVEATFSDVGALNSLLTRLGSIASEKGVLTIEADKKALKMSVSDHEAGFGELSDAIEVKSSGKCTIKVNHYTLTTLLACVKKSCVLQVYEKGGSKSLRILTGSGDTVIELYCSVVG